MDLSHEPFNPYHLRPLATLNSRVVIDLPGVEATCVGKSGFELISRRALIELIQAKAGELGLETVDPGEYPIRLNERLDQPDHPAYPAALSIGEEVGRRLGGLIASILLSPVGLTNPLAPWEAGYLRHWREVVREIALGGGHASGRLGEVIARAAEGALGACGLAEYHVHPAGHPSFLPLTGAARMLLVGLPAGADGQRLNPTAPRIVADFGGTRAKCGIAFYDERGRLARLEILPPYDISTLTTAEDVPGLAARMVEILAETVGHSPALPAGRILCSVAAYTQAGRPLDTNRGIYNLLNRIDADVKGWFSRQISIACRREMQVEFGHDCDLAACALAGSPRTAVVMMGSALGVGFVPPAEGYAEVGEEFTTKEVR